MCLDQSDIASSSRRNVSSAIARLGVMPTPHMYLQADAPSLLPPLLPSVHAALRDADDDVRATAAAALQAKRPVMYTPTEQICRVLKTLGK